MGTTVRERDGHRKFHFSGNGEGEREKKGREGGISITHKLQTFCELKDQYRFCCSKFGLTCFRIILSLQQHGFKLN